MVELRHLRAFLFLAEELHFGRAARRFGIAQPPFSQQIRRLEAELGVRLFDRNNRRVSLSVAGQAFLEGARRVLNESAHAVEAARLADQGKTGVLRIGFAASAAFSVLPPLIRRFREQFPLISLRVEEAISATQLDALSCGTIDAGIVRGPLDGGSLTVETVLAEPFLVALPASHSLAGRKRVPLRALAEDPFVLFPRRLAPGFHEAILSLCASAGFQPRIIQEAAEWQTIICLVAAEFGVTLVPASVEALGRGGVCYRPLSDGSGRAELALVWSRERASPARDAFIEVARTISRAVVLK